MQNNFYRAQILIIDDAPDSITAAATVLQDADYQLRIAINAATALPLIAQLPPDLILLDVNLPDIDGFTLCRKLKASPDYAAIPIIFLTASDNEKHIQTAFSLGACDYVTKPFRKSELSARVSTQLRLYQQQQELKKAYDELDSFCASVAHDLKSPLLSISQLIQILRDDFAPHLPQDGLELVHVLQDKSADVITIIDHLLEFSRASKTSMNTSIVDMQILSEKIFAELHSACPKRQITFHAAELPSLPGDPILLQQLLRNILSNAIKYTAKKDDAHITLNCTATKNDYIFCCQDNGVGFDMRYANRLFHVFERLHSSREFSGSGVGLAICQRIIQRHHGKIWLEGTPGKGASCWFSLPKTIPE